MLSSSQRRIARNRAGMPPRAWIMSLLLLVLVSFSQTTSAWDLRLLFRRRRQRHKQPEQANQQPPKVDISAEDNRPSPSPLESLVSDLQSFLWYKPPVGLVVLLATWRLIFRGRLFSVYRPKTTMLQRQQHREKKQPKRAPSWDLDADDRCYEIHGGVEIVRMGLCRHILREEFDANDSDDDKVLLQKATLEALHKSCSPGKARGTLVEKMAPHLAVVLISTSASDSNVLKLGAKVAEVRALDALLRQGRDGLLTTLARLSRLQKYWQNRVEMRRWRIMQFVIQKIPEHWKRSSLDGDRMRLAMARAAYQAELNRLGRLQKVMLDRPRHEMGEDLFLKAAAISNGPTTQNNIMERLPLISRFALRWNADKKKQWFSIGVYDGSISVSAAGARAVLLEYGNNEQWMSEAQEWARQARHVLYVLVREPLETGRDSNTTETMQDLQKMEAWSQYDKVQCADETCWTTVLRLVDHAVSSHRRVGESRAVGLTEVLFLNWFERMDVLGIPSSLGAVWIASVVHNKLAPRWPEIQAALVSAFTIVWGILSRRFWKPLMAIVSDLMNKSPKLLDSFDLDVEETSLDRMLQDLGVGDGRPESRKEALQGAAALYEENLRSNVVTNILRGRVIRLMLVQIQQLKAGLLKAMGSIDTLVDSNRLNVQILAAIPAFLLLAVGSNLFFRLLVGFRTKRYLRPLKAIYNEMTEYLYKMETLLLLSRRGGGQEEEEFSQQAELGEVVLYMHSYVVLLDSCTPPFPLGLSESIHRSIQDLLSSQRDVSSKGITMGTDRHIALVRLIKEKHAELRKYL